MKLSFPIVLTVVLGVFAASFMDAIAGGGGIISLPIYLLAGLPPHLALGTNKLSSSLGTIASASRYIKNGYVNWKLAFPSIMLALIGSHFGTKLQLLVSDNILQYILLFILPIVALIVLRQRTLPEQCGQINIYMQYVIVCSSSLIIGTYDGFYGPGTGTFLLLIYCNLARLDVRTASGNVKLVNLSSNVGAVLTSMANHQIFYVLGLIGATSSILGHFLGSGLAIRNGSKIIRPMVILILALLIVKIVLGFFI